MNSYYARHGLGGTVVRLGISAKRALFAGRMVLYYCDLSTLSSHAPELQGSLRVERYTCENDVNRQDLTQITSFWNPKLAEKNLKERFGVGASLWLLKSEGQLAGYGWSLQGRTVEPHFFRLASED